MAGLIERPTDGIRLTGDAEAVERLLSTRSPQRPQRTPSFYVEIDGERLEAFEGQTILEVCRANGIEVPTLCYDRSEEHTSELQSH